METSSLAASALLMRSEQTQMVFSATMMKQAAAMQNQLANLLARSPGTAPSPVTGSSTDFSFSTYA